MTSYLASPLYIPQISYAATDPTLSDNFDLFSRTVAPVTSKGPTLIALMKHYNWTKTVMLTSTDGVWFESGLQLTAQLQVPPRMQHLRFWGKDLNLESWLELIAQRQEAAIEVQKLAAFKPERFKNATMSEIKHFGIRIVTFCFGSCYVFDAQ